MTISSTTSSTAYTGDNSTTVFSIGFSIQAATHISVYYLLDGGTSSTLWVKDVDYTVSTDLTSITATTAPATDSTLTILRNVPLTQETDLKDNSAAKAEVTETALDKLTQLIQQVDERLDRAVLQDPTATTTSLVLPSPSAGKALIWNDNEDGLTNSIVADLDAVVLPASGVCVSGGSNTLIGRTITGTASEITVTNGSGVSGNPTISLDSGVYRAAGTDVPVTDGGTGVSTMTTAYAPVCAGTTATGALQVASTGLSTSGYVLTSNGASAVPSFQAPQGQMVLIQSQSASSSATIDFTGLSSTYKTYIIYMTDVILATDNIHLYYRVGTGGTPTYDTGANYSWACVGQASGGVAEQAGSTGDTKMGLNMDAAGFTIGNVSGENFSGQMTIYNPSNSSTYKKFGGTCAYDGAGGESMTANFGGTYKSATAVTAIRFYASSGNITSGTFTLFGIKHT